jgi:hypothetical protein
MNLQDVIKNLPQTKDIIREIKNKIKCEYFRKK